MNSPRVATGLDVLLDDRKRLDELRGRSVGLLVNPTSISADFDHAIEALRQAGLDIVRLFGPEHGVRADAQDMEAVDETVDPISGLPTVSLYGDTVDSLRPDEEHLRDLDIVICDIQDIGARYYTYVYTIGLMMDACGRADTPVMVLDRPNPLGGIDVEGNVVADDMRSFVGMQPLANRHGMTAGELAHFFDRFGGWSCNLEVVEMDGWKRSMWFDDTGLPWVMPSPNMPTLETACVYPGQCLLEGTNLSEGRGTTRPFELFGAPYVDANALAEYLNALALDGVQFRTTAFRPTFQKHGGTTCHGLQLHVTDRRSFSSTATSYGILAGLLELHGDLFQWRTEAYEFVRDRLAIDLLIGDKDVRLALEDGADPLQLVASLADDRSEFDVRRTQCLLYEA